jgi:hypothetical protein
MQLERVSFTGAPHLLKEVALSVDGSFKRMMTG